MKYEQAISLLVNATYSREWQGNEKLAEAQHMAIDALKKQIPVPLKRWKDTNIHALNSYPCGACGKAIHITEQYCEYCGQRAGNLEGVST